jgi:hypothetical protein
MNKELESTEQYVEPVTQERVPRAWITYRKKDGSGLHTGTIATNPEYVKLYKEWHWIELHIPPDGGATK